MDIEFHNQDSSRIGQKGLAGPGCPDGQFALENLSPKAINRLLADMKRMSVPDRAHFLHQLDLKAKAGDPRALQAQIDIMNSRELSQAASAGCKFLLEESLETLNYHSISSDVSLFTLHLATLSDPTLANHMDDRLEVATEDARHRMSGQANVLKESMKNGRSPRYVERMEKDLARTVSHLGDLKDLQNAIGQTAAPFVTRTLRERYDQALSSGKRPEIAWNRFDGKRINFRNDPQGIETRTMDESPRKGGFSLKNLFGSFHFPKISFPALKDSFIGFFSSSSHVRLESEVKFGRDPSEESLGKIEKRK